MRAAVGTLRGQLTGARPEAGWVPLRRRRPGLRRWLAAGAVAAAAAGTLQTLAPEPAPGRTVVVAARDVPAGAALQRSDLTLVTRPAEELPATVVNRVDDAVGLVLASTLSAREVVTSGRLVGSGLLAGRPPDQVAAPVRIADAAAAALLRPGSRVDVLVAVEGAHTARTVARGATVLARPDRTDDGLLASGADNATGGGLVLLAVSDSVAASLAQSAAAGPLSVVIR